MDELKRANQVLVKQSVSAVPRCALCSLNLNISDRKIHWLSQAADNQHGKSQS